MVNAFKLKVKIEGFSSCSWRVCVREWGKSSSFSVWVSPLLCIEPDSEWEIHPSSSRWSWQRSPGGPTRVQLQRKRVREKRPAKEEVCVQTPAQMHRSASKHVQTLNYKGQNGRPVDTHTNTSLSIQQKVSKTSSWLTGTHTCTHTHSSLTSYTNHAASRQLMELEGVIMRHKGLFFCTHILSYSHCFPPCSHSFLTLWVQVSLSPLLSFSLYCQLLSQNFGTVQVDEDSKLLHLFYSYCSLAVWKSTAAGRLPSLDIHFDP